MVTVTYGLFVESDVATIENLKRDSRESIVADLDHAIFCYADKDNLKRIQHSVDKLVLQNTFDNPEEKKNKAGGESRGAKRPNVRR